MDRPKRAPWDAPEGEENAAKRLRGDADGTAQAHWDTAAAGGQPQFRYTQPPSKVLHVRNLPWEATSEELQAICAPFGKVLNTKMNVGPSKNQAFVEMETLHQAIALVSFYAAAAEPPTVRGKGVFFQYSTRQEIVGGKANDNPTTSNVLLVTFEDMGRTPPPIDALHLVFSTFGMVQKIATFEKAAGFQALIQFVDEHTAEAARAGLDTREVPRYLLPNSAGPCIMRISFSAHNNLNVKFQSHRSRDYTNPYLPVAPSAAEPLAGAPTQSAGTDSRRAGGASNVLLVTVDNMQYPVSLDTLHTVFSAFGFVQKIAVFEKNQGLQALIQYPDLDTATTAKDTLQGHCVYEGGFCKLAIAFSRHAELNIKTNGERSRDYTNPHLPTDTSKPPSVPSKTFDVAASVAAAPPASATVARLPPAPERTQVPDARRSSAPHSQDGDPVLITGYEYEKAHNAMAAAVNAAGGASSMPGGAGGNRGEEGWGGGGREMGGGQFMPPPPAGAENGWGPGPMPPPFPGYPPPGGPPPDGYGLPLQPQQIPLMPPPGQPYNPQLHGPAY
eukprot:jgi/Mesvir1/23238/Mv09240-RA.2